MKAPRTSRRWTIARIFWTSLATVPISAVITIFAGGLWWRLAFDWDPNARPHYYAYPARWLEFLGAAICIAAALLTLFFGIWLLSRKIAGARPVKEK